MRTCGGAFGLAMLAGCSSAPVVSVETVGARDLAATVAAAECSVRSARVARVTAGISARVERVAVVEGSRVAEGDVLVEIGGARADAEAQRYRAAVETARAVVEGARVAVEDARVRLRLAADAVRRQTRLRAARHVSRAALREALGEAEAARAAVAAREAAAREAAARLRAAQADHANARRTADREARVLAPFAGTVARLYVEPGQQVQAGESRHRGSLLLRLEDLSRLAIDAWVAAPDVAPLAKGQPVAVTVDPWPEREYRGRVEAVGYAPAGGGLYRAQVAPAGVWDGVRPGFTCEAEITTARRRGALAVPKLALLRRDGTDGVWVVRGGRVSFVPVALGVAGAAHVEVLSGLRGGESVVTGPFEVAGELAPGVTVQAGR